MSNLNSLLESVKSSSPATFQKTLKEELNERLGIALSECKKDTVANMFGITVDETPDSETE